MYCKDMQTYFIKLIFGTWDMSGYANPKRSNRLAENLDVYLYARNKFYHQFLS